MGFLLRPYTLLEEAREKLQASLAIFLSRLALCTYPGKNNPHFQTMGFKDFETDPELLQNKKELNDLGSECFELHQAFIRAARKRGRVDNSDEQNQDDHDKNVFLRGEQILSESVIRRVASGLVDRYTIPPSDLATCEEFGHFCDLVGNRFFEKRLLQLRANFAISLDELTDYAALHFSPARGGLLELYPEMLRIMDSLPGGSPPPEIVAQKLAVKGLVSKVINNFELYRVEVKNRLSV